MGRTVEVALGARSYAIEIGSGMDEVLTAFVLADAVCSQFSADNMTDLQASLAAYRARLAEVWQNA